MSWTYLALPANRHNNQNKPTARGSRKLTAGLQKGRCWVQRVDSNHRHSGYEPDELPDCSTLRYMMPKCHLSRNRVRITDWFIVWLRTCLQPRIGSHFVGRLSKIRTYNVSNVTELRSAAFTVRHTNLNKTYLLAGGREPVLITSPPGEGHDIRRIRTSGALRHKWVQAIRNKPDSAMMP